MRELEGQTMSDVSGEVAGMQAGSTGDLFLLVKPREMTVKNMKRVMLMMSDYFCDSNNHFKEDE